MMEQLLELSSSSRMPAVSCSKRKQAHTVIAECEYDLLTSAQEEEPPIIQQQLQYNHHHHIGLFDSLDSLLASRQNSGVFLKDPNVCLTDWASTIMAATAPEHEETKHPGFPELYSSFETQGACEPSQAVTIIPLTPDQVSRLTAVSPTPQLAIQPQLIVSSPVSEPFTPPPGTTASTTSTSSRARQPTRRRRPTPAALTPDSDEDDEVDGDGAGVDSEYRRRRERNNVAVRKSRAKTRAREQAVDQTLGRLRNHNEDLRKKVDSVVRELKFLKSLMHKTRIPMPQELINALHAYPTYFEPVE